MSMQKLGQWKKQGKQGRVGWARGAGALLLAVALAAPAAAGTAWRWTQADGSVAFTDDPDRIPERYQGTAQKIETGSLDAYARLSPSRESDADARLGALRARTERLRKVVAEAELDEQLRRAGATATGVAGAPTGFEARVEVNGSTIRLPVAHEGEGPLVVEQVRSYRRGKSITQEATVVRRGDEILMLVYPDPSQQINSHDFVREEELLESL